MDGPGHTAISFRLDSLIRSLEAPLREQIVSHPTEPDERWSAEEEEEAAGSTEEAYSTFQCLTSLSLILLPC